VHTNPTISNAHALLKNNALTTEKLTQQLDNSLNTEAWEYYHVHVAAW